MWLSGKKKLRMLGVGVNLAPRVSLYLFPIYKAWKEQETNKKQ